MTAFISYRRVDQDKVNALQQKLSSLGAETWIDRISIAPGQVWAPEIDSAIKEASYFVACFSALTEDERAFRETYMHKELMIAAKASRSRPEGWLIPVLIDACVMPDIEIRDGLSIRGINATSVAGQDWEEGTRRLAEIIGELRKKDAQRRLRDSARRVREADMGVLHAEARCEYPSVVDSVKEIWAERTQLELRYYKIRDDYEREVVRYIDVFRERFDPYIDQLDDWQKVRNEVFETYRQKHVKEQEDTTKAQRRFMLVIFLLMLVPACLILVAVLFG